MQRLPLRETVIRHRNVIVEVFVVVVEHPDKVVLRAENGAGSEDGGRGESLLDLHLTIVLCSVVETLTVLVLTQSTHVDESDYILISLTCICYPAGHFDVGRLVLSQELTVLPWPY